MDAFGASDPIHELIRAQLAAHPETNHEIDTGSETPEPRGTLRSREDFELGNEPLIPRYLSSPHLGTGDSFGSMSSINAFVSGLAVYTLEMGREYKRHKGLSQESDADADKFLKVNQFTYYHNSPRT